MRIDFDSAYINLLIVLAALVIIIHILAQRSMKKRLIRFANYRLLKTIIGRELISNNTVVLIIRLMIALLIFISVADITIYQDSLAAVSDYVIAVDTSSSMADKFAQVSDVAIGFVDNIPKEAKIGVISFSGESMINCVLGYDRDTVKRNLVNLTVSVPAGTSINKVLISSAALLDMSNKSKKIVLITDGTIRENIDFGINDSINTIKSKNVSVYTIGIPTENKSLEWRLESLERLKRANSNDEDYVRQIDESIMLIKNETSYLDEYTLSRIANESGGSFYSAVNTSIFEESMGDIIDIDKTEVDYNLTTMSVLLLSLLIIIEWGLGVTKYKTIP